MLVAQDSEGAAADLPAGVTEVLVIADDSARADFVAADLLAQAEHSPDAQAILLTPSSALADATVREVGRQSALLSRKRILEDPCGKCASSLSIPSTLRSKSPTRTRLSTCCSKFATPRKWLEKVSAAGAVFLGRGRRKPWATTAADPTILCPTYGYARSHSGLALEDFQKRIIVQELTPSGLKHLGPTAQVLAKLEGLDAHAAAVTVRLAAWRNTQTGSR